jgi:predicted DNA-binding transcriptional regulator YafY
MPRNDQITRQGHLLRRLENSRGLTLSELVEAVPEDYPKNARTVRRDLEALEAVGFPLVTERHNGQTHWRLIEGFRDIPALGFSATELMALTFSRKLLQAFGRYQDSVSAQLRIKQGRKRLAAAGPRVCSRAG